MSVRGGGQRVARVRTTMGNEFKGEAAHSGDYFGDTRARQTSCGGGTYRVAGGVVGYCVSGRKAGAP